MYCLEEMICDKWWLNAPTGGAIDISLSFRTTTMRVFLSPALFSASNAIPALIDPSPMTATTLFFRPRMSRATAMPTAAETDVELCPAPNASNGLSERFGKPDKPSSQRSRSNFSRRPVSNLCAYA